MWVEKRDGRFRACEYYKDELTGKRKRAIVYMEKNTAKTRRAAVVELEKRIQGRRLVVEPDKLTLEQLCDQYMVDQRITNRASTVTRNEFACKKVMKLFGSDALVDRLTAGYVRKAILESGMEPVSANEFLTRFKSLLKWGYENDLVEDVLWLNKLKPFKDDSKMIKVSERYLEQDEIDKLLEGMQEGRWIDLTLFLILTGLRIGEALALNINDIDLKKREIHVSKTYDYNNNVVNDDTKTAAGRRDVSIQDELYPLCQNLKALARVEKMQSGVDLLFQQDGIVYQYPSYSRYLRKNSERILGRRVTPHMMRHTHVSMLAASGLTFDEISRRVGHEDSRITRQIYFHVTENLKERERERIRKVKILS